MESKSLLNLRFMLRYVFTHALEIIGLIIFFSVGLIYRIAGGQFGYIGLLTGGIACTVTMCLALYCIFKTSLSAPDFRQGISGLLLTNITIFALAMFCCIFFSNKASMDFAVWVSENFRSQWITNGALEICTAFLLISICIGLYAGFGIWRGKSELFVTVVHATGFCVYLEAVSKVWRDVSDPGTAGGFARCGLIYGLTMILVVVSMLLLRKKEQLINSTNF